MEKDVFQPTITTIEGFVEGKSETPVHTHEIPLPNQLPAPVDTKQWPIEVLKSSAINSLINQNEDLHSRLTVQIRKNALTEEKMNALHKQLENKSSQLENLKDQIIVYRKKDQAVTDRYTKVDSEIKAKQEKIDFLEVKYSEYYNTTSSKLEELQHEVVTLSTKKSLLARHKRRLLKIAKKYRVEIDKNILKVEEYESTISTLQQQLGEAAEHIQSMSKNNKSLVDELEGKYNQLKLDSSNSIENLSKQIDSLSEQLSRQNEVEDSNINLKNSIITLKRQLEAQDIDAQSNLEKVQKELGSFRIEAKEKTVQLHKLEEQNSNLIRANEKLENLVKESTEENENIKILWKEHQSENERLQEQNSSLQKLNRQLSLKMNEYRQEMKNLKVRLEAKTMFSEGNEKYSDIGDQKKQEEHNRTIEKIDHLLKEIQSGFTNNSSTK
ncbi:MAG: hypothetical protein CL677_03000 [Bdellovibrionaceae bacterium]|nr:hypothetical protein [Pseudobdellovibrionaceae bacterium]|tara:strand:+ start:88192 stop:89511 length:1320 start_codon:yes stop_codon:yes gene_type:complete